MDSLFRLFESYNLGNDFIEYEFLPYLRFNFKEYHKKNYDWVMKELEQKTNQIYSTLNVERLVKLLPGWNNPTHKYIFGTNYFSLTLRSDVKTFPTQFKPYVDINGGLITSHRTKWNGEVKCHEWPLDDLYFAVAFRYNKLPYYETYLKDNNF